MRSYVVRTWIWARSPTQTLIGPACSWCGKPAEGPVEVEAGRKGTKTKGWARRETGALCSPAGGEHLANVRTEEPPKRRTKNKVGQRNGNAAQKHQAALPSPGSPKAVSTAPRPIRASARRFLGRRSRLRQAVSGLSLGGRASASGRPSGRGRCSPGSHGPSPGPQGRSEASRFAGTGSPGASLAEIVVDCEDVAAPANDTRLLTQTPYAPPPPSPQLWRPCGLVLRTASRSRAGGRPSALRMPSVRPARRCPPRRRQTR